MKIDLHLHTKFSKPNGDSIKWVSLKETIKTLHKHNVGAFAFTDHNVFNARQFLHAKSIVKNHMHAFPGIEINILSHEGRIANLIVIFDNELSDEELQKLEVITNNNLRKKGIRIQHIKNIYRDYETILIPHVGKSDYFTPLELTMFEHDAIEITSYNHRNYKTWKKLNMKNSIVAFSDTHIWNNYPQVNTLHTEISFDGSFQDLKNKLKHNFNYVKEKIKW